VFLIGLTGGELLRQHTLDATAVAATSGPTEPMAATSAPAVNPAVLSATSSTTVDCDPSSCLDQAAKQESQTEDGKGRGHGKEGKDRGRRGKGGTSGKG
jgi:hypothetical protein